MDFTSSRLNIKIIYNFKYYFIERIPKKKRIIFGTFGKSISVPLKAIVKYQIQSKFFFFIYYNCLDNFTEYNFIFTWQSQKSTFKTEIIDCQLEYPFKCIKEISPEGYTQILFKIYQDYQIKSEIIKFP